MVKLIIHGFTHLVNAVIAILKDDYTELWLIVSKVSEENPHFSFEELTQATLDILTYVSNTNNLVQIDETTEKPFSKSKTDILSTVKNRLEELDRAPNIGDGIWLSII